MQNEIRRDDLIHPEEFVDRAPEDLAPPMQGRMEPDHGPLTDDLIDPEDARGFVENDLNAQSIINTTPDEVDAFGNRLEHEGTWTQTAEGDLTDEDVADTHDWRDVPVDEEAPEDDLVNEKIADGLSGGRIDDTTGRPLE